MRRKRQRETIDSRIDDRVEDRERPVIDDFEEAIGLGTERLVHVHRDGIRQRVLGCAGSGPYAGEVTDNLAVDHERQFCPECIVHYAVDIDRGACGQDMYIL